MQKTFIWWHCLGNDRELLEEDMSDFLGMNSQRFTYKNLRQEQNELLANLNIVIKHWNFYNGTNSYCTLPTWSNVIRTRKKQLKNRQSIYYRNTSHNLSYLIIESNHQRFKIKKSQLTHLVFVASTFRIIWRERTSISALINFLNF